jgi:hypothetical protein
MYSQLSDLRITRAQVQMLMTNDKVEKRRNLFTFIKESQRKTKIADYLPKVRYVCIIYIINKLHIYYLFLLENPGGKKITEYLSEHSAYAMCVQYYAYNK